MGHSIFKKTLKQIQTINLWITQCLHVWTRPYFALIPAHFCILLGPRCFIIKTGGYWKLAVWRWRGPTQTGVHRQTDRIKGNYCNGNWPSLHLDFFFFFGHLFHYLIYVYCVGHRNWASPSRTGIRRLKRDLKHSTRWGSRSSSTWNLLTHIKWR